MCLQLVFYIFYIVINTARGICVREAEMLAALKDRRDVIALLDVTEPEPPVPGSEMFDMPNVVTFPHIAGSLDGECKRLTRLAIDDFYRFRAGNPLQNELSLWKLGLSSCVSFCQSSRAFLSLSICGWQSAASMRFLNSCGSVSRS